MGVTLQNHLSLMTREKLIQLLSYYTYKTIKYIGLPIFLCVMKSLSEAPIMGKSLNSRAKVKGYLLFTQVKKIYFLLTYSKNYRIS